MNSPAQIETATSKFITKISKIVSTKYLERFHFCTRSEIQNDRDLSEPYFFTLQD